MADTPVAVACSLGGEYMVLTVNGCTLSSRNLTTEADIRSVELPHTIRAVFLADAPGEQSSIVYVVVDGPEPVVEVDYVCGVFRTVLDASTQRALLARRSSDVAVDFILSSRGGRHVAVARSDGSVMLYRVETDSGSPSFVHIDYWETSSRVRTMVFAGADVLRTDSILPDDVLPSYIVVLAQKHASSGQLIRLAIEQSKWIRVISAGVDATTLSTEPGDPELVALFSPTSSKGEASYTSPESEMCYTPPGSEVSYMNVRSITVEFTYLIQTVVDTCYPSCVALRGGEHGKYAAVVSDGTRAVVMTGDDDVGVKMLPKTLEAGTLWRALAVGGTTAAIARKTETVLVDVGPSVS